MNMISFKTVLRKKKLSTGRYPIYLRITKDRKSIFFRTPYTSTEDEWDSKQGKFNKQSSYFLEKNRLLLKFIDQATNVVTRLQQEKGYYSLLDIETGLRVESNPVSSSVFAFWDEIIDEMEKAGRTGNARIYRDTSKSFRKYCKHRILHFEEVTPAFLEKYEVYLRSRSGTDGGIAVQMRTFRALFNMAINRGLIKQDIYPFNVYKISKLKGRGVKKALSLEDVQKCLY